MTLDSAQADGLNRSAVWKVREGGMDEARGDIVAGLVPVRKVRKKRWMVRETRALSR